MTSSFNRVDDVRPDAPPLVRGAHPVGVETRVLVDQGRVMLEGAPLDRSLTVEVWYPTDAVGAGCTYETHLRDGVGRAVLHGSATRGAQPLAGEPGWLVIVSHGYPGNRHLMAHFGEGLASHGYRVVSIDHPGSTYADKADFAQTLWHRPLDQQFVARAFGGEHVIIGYSMGGYGALIAAGAGLSEAAMTAPGVPEAGLYARHRTPKVSGHLKGIIPIGAWGRQRGFWDAAGLAAMRVPMLMMAGSADDISGYETGMRRIFDEAGGARWLLTFAQAGHNAAAPIPAPREAWAPSPHLDFVPFEHYADAVWDTVRMNNIACHAAAGFVGRVLRGAGDGPEVAGLPGVTLEHRISAR